MIRHPLLTLSAVVLLATTATAQVTINELFINPEDIAPDDDGLGREFFELKSDSGGAVSLDGLWLLEINAGFDDAGVIDQAIPLTGQSTGTNGLFLWRDSADALVPAADPATVVQVDSPVNFGNGDSFSFLIVSGFTGSVGQDLDPDANPLLNNTLEITPWASIVDAVVINDTGDPFVDYSAQLGGAEFTSSFGPDAFSSPSNTDLMFFFDSDEGEQDPAFFGPFTGNNSDNENLLSNGVTVPLSVASAYQLTPGSTNDTLPQGFVPEPSAAVLALVAAGFAAARRR